MRKFTVLKDSIIPWKNENGSTGTRKLKAGSSISGDEHELKVYVDLNILRPIFEPVATNKAAKVSVAATAPAKAAASTDELPEEPVVVDEDPVVPEPEAEPETEAEEPASNLPETLAELKAMSKEALVELAKKLKLNSEGTKGQLVSRLSAQLFE